MAKQEQEATGNAIAIQSQRDTIINQGVSPTDMKTILDALASQQITYTAVAREIVDARLFDFEERILRRFAEDNKVRAEAFKDPDFQYLLTRAQHAHARSGDEDIRDTLVDLIAERSKQTDRNRLALSLNQAVEKAALLTKNEFAELSVSYLYRYTLNHTVNNFQKLTEYLSTSTAPFLNDLSREESSFSYIESQGCGTVSITSMTLRDIIAANYGGLISKGWDEEAFSSLVTQYGLLPFANNPQVFRSCLQDASKKQANAVRKDVFEEVGRAAGMTPEQITGVWTNFEATMMSRDELVAALEPLFTSAGKLFSLWDETPLKSLLLTSVGIAIAHANSVRVAGFDADLSIWIK
jgi:hypothetical protein